MNGVGARSMENILEHKGRYIMLAAHSRGRDWKKNQSKIEEQGRGSGSRRNDQRPVEEEEQ
jgi:hypothetical protein